MSAMAIQWICIPITSAVALIQVAHSQGIKRKTTDARIEHNVKSCMTKADAFVHFI